jgi:hypothetical protein
MKRALLALALISVPAVASPAKPKLLDCNLNFGPVQQVTVEKGAAGLTYSYLTDYGQWINGQDLDADAWANHEVKFDVRGERVELTSKDGRNWEYRVYEGSSGSANVIGDADCD